MGGSLENGGELKSVNVSWIIPESECHEYETFYANMSRKTLGLGSWCGSNDET